MFHLTITADDVDRFVVDPRAPGHAPPGTSSATCSAGRLPVQRGWFNLFTREDGDRARRRMLYRLHFADAGGNPLTLVGHKDVHDDPGRRRLARTPRRSTSRLHAGHVPPGDGPTEDGRVVAAGVITIHLPDFLRQLTTFRTEGTAPGARDGGVRPAVPRPAVGGLRTGAVAGAGDDRTAARAGPRRRPDSLADLPFPRHQAVRWFDPRMLVQTAKFVALSSVFGTYADKREVQATAARPSRSTTTRPRDETWVDYVSDVGDGFDATYSMAYLLAQPKLDVTSDGPARSPCRRPAAAVLVMGGDEVYPTASAQRVRGADEGPLQRGPAALGRPARAVRRAGQPRLVRRAHGVPPVLLPGRLGRRLADRAAAQLLRGEAAAALVAAGHRHPVRHLHRRAADRLLPDRRRADRGRRRHHPVHAKPSWVEGGEPRLEGLRHPRLLHLRGARQATRTRCG